MKLIKDPIAIYYLQVTHNRYIEYYDFGDFLFQMDLVDENFSYVRNVDCLPDKIVYDVFSASTCRKLFGKQTNKFRRELIKLIRDQGYSKVGDKIYTIEDE